MEPEVLDEDKALIIRLGLNAHLILALEARDRIIAMSAELREKRAAIERVEAALADLFSGRSPMSSEDETRLGVMIRAALAQEGGK